MSSPSPLLSVRVVLLPSLLTPDDVAHRVVVAFDLLRATTTLAAALSAGITSLQLHPTLDSARSAHAASLPSNPTSLLIGEEKCLKPADFHLGNSPSQFTPDHANRSAHIATTNGTRALLLPYTLAQPHAQPLAVLAGSLSNRLAIAKACLHLCTSAAPPTSSGGGNSGGGAAGNSGGGVAGGVGGVTLLCAGTEGQPSYEDLLGCGAVLESFVNLHCLGPVNDAALMAMGTWTWSAAGIVRAKPNEPAYPAGFRLAQGAKNLISAGLPHDVETAARVDTLSLVPTVSPTGLVTRLQLP